MNDKENKDQSFKRRKRAVFDPHKTRNPLSDIFDSPKGKPEPTRPEVQARPTHARPSQPAPKPARPTKKNYEPIDGIDPVELFAAYHLGLTKEKTFKPQNIHDVARRFRCSPARIKEILVAFDLDAESVMTTDFDMGLAQLDIKVAPEGIDRGEIARQLYNDYREAPKIVRDWNNELTRDAEENRRIFEKLK